MAAHDKTAPALANPVLFVVDADPQARAVTESALARRFGLDYRVLAAGAIGLVAVPPVLLGTAYGIWKENQLDKEVWQVIDERVNAPEEPGP